MWTKKKNNKSITENNTYDSFMFTTYEINPINRSCQGERNRIQASNATFILSSNESNTLLRVNERLMIVRDRKCKRGWVLGALKRTQHSRAKCGMPVHHKINYGSLFYGQDTSIDAGLSKITDGLENHKEHDRLTQKRVQTTPM